MSNFAEPGFWLLIAIVVLGASQALGAALARPHFRKLNEIAEAILASPEANAGDRSWLQDTLRDASNRMPVWATSLLAPLFAVYAAFEAVRTVMSEQTAQEMDVELDNLIRQNSQMLGGVDPQTGAFWRDPRRSEASDAAFAALLLSSPILLLWLFLWVAPALGILTLGGAAAVVRRSVLRTTLERASGLSWVRVGR